jgi:hypothetical protein
MIEKRSVAGVLVAQSTAAAGETFVRTPALVVLAGSSPWQEGEIRSALSAATGRCGLALDEHARAGYLRRFPCVAQHRKNGFRFRNKAQIRENLAQLVVRRRRRMTLSFRFGRHCFEILASLSFVSQSNRAVCRSDIVIFSHAVKRLGAGRRSPCSMNSRTDEREGRVNRYGSLQLHGRGHQ